MNTTIIRVAGSNGKLAAIYRIEGDVLVKKCNEKHIFKARQAIGVDEALWQEYRDRVQTVRFEWDGRIYEVTKDDFERSSFLHGDNVSFVLTRFVRLSDLNLVREAPPARGQLALALL